MSRPPATETVRDAILARIIHGELEPGDRLVEDQIARDYGVSRIPVREALRMLAAEGFVLSKAYSGSYVAEISDREATDLLHLRSLLEPVAAAKAAEHRTDQQLARLHDLVARGRAAHHRRRYAEVSDLNGTFHEAVAAASGSPTLASFVSQLRVKIDWVYGRSVRRRAEASWDEHADLVDAIGGGDAALARQLMLDHLDHSAAAFAAGAGSGSGEPPSSRAR